MVNLYPHQIAAVKRLHNGSILCGRVGSGKSRAALAYYFEKICGGTIPDRHGLPSMSQPTDLYIITTAKKRDNLEWEGECVPFGLTTHPENDIFGVNVKVDSWNNIGKYCNICGAFFIFDEQRLVGSGAWVKAFYQIAKKNRWILLSATPGDKWEDYIPVFVANGFYKNKTAFCREHIVYSNYTKFPKIERYSGVRKLMLLREQILVHMEFATPTIPHHKYLNVSYHRELYNETARKRWNPYTNEPIAEVAGYCSVLRKIVNSSDGRISETIRLINEHPRLIIFYNFDYELEILRNVCRELDVTFAEWNGHKHMPIPEVKKHPRWVYLVQYAAGAEGWNCIDTDAILFYSLSYSYKTMIQAAGRIDRLNTTYLDLYYYYLYSDSPIDTAIMRCLRDKKDFNERRFVKL